MAVFEMRKCFTGRRWLHIGSFLAIGFGPKYLIERVWTKKTTWAKYHGVWVRRLNNC